MKPKMNFGMIMFLRKMKKNRLRFAYEIKTVIKRKNESFIELALRLRL